MSDKNKCLKSHAVQRGKKNKSKTDLLAIHQKSYSSGKTSKVDKYKWILKSERKMENKQE